MFFITISGDHGAERRHIAGYEVLEQIGAGGMGVVYRARDNQLGRIVALKSIAEKYRSDAVSRVRLLREARSASALNHPNIVTIYGVVSEGDADFIAMEYVEGRTLEQTIISSKGLPLNQSLAYAIQVAEGLGAAHKAGIIHRDLKPSNIMVTGGDRVKIMDFGLARIDQASAAAADGDTEALTGAAYTDPGAIIGTTSYMSPEQAEGRPVDARSDIFAFGAVLYEMLAGRRAFQRSSRISTLNAITSEEPKPLPDLRPETSPELQRVLARCLRKDPAKRFQHIDDVRVALAELKEESESGTATPVQRRRLKWPLLAVAAMLIVAVPAAILIRRAVQTAADPRRLTKLTSDSGLTAFPTLSPDGRFVAYASDRAGKGDLDIWLQQVGGGDPIRLTSDPSDDLEPAFSPDGTKIAFRSERQGGGIYVVPALGGPARLVAAGGRRPRFSPDGKLMAYFTGDISGGVPAVYVVSTGGGPVREIAPGSRFHSPVWSSDSRRLLVTRAREFRPAWAILDVETGAITEVGVPPVGAVTAGTQQLIPSVWKGRQVIYAGRQGATVSLFRSELSYGNRIEGTPERLTFGTAEDIQPDWSSGRIVFASRSFSYDLWTAKRTRGEASELRRITTDNRFKGYASIAPDGSVAAFRSDTGGGISIRVVSLETGEGQSILTRPQQLWGVLFSPDSRTIAFSSVLLRSTYLFNREGGTESVLCTECGRAEDWSPDGRWILFMTNVEEGSEYQGAVEVSTKQKADVYRLEKRRVQAGRFSPDGKWVAFQSDTGPMTRRLYIAPFRGNQKIPESEWIAITDGKRLERSPAWSPEGDTVYFESMRDGFHCFWAQPVDVKTKQPVKAAYPVLHFHTSRRSLVHVGDIAAVGLRVWKDQFFMTLAEVTSNVWMLDLPE